MVLVQELGMVVRYGMVLVPYITMVILSFVILLKLLSHWLIHLPRYLPTYIPTYRVPLLT